MAKEVLTISPGERYEILVDFSSNPGNIEALQLRVLNTPYRDRELWRTFLGFNVARSLKGKASIPGTLVQLERLDPKDAVQQRSIRLEGYNRINGRVFDMKRVSFTPKKGSIEEWHITNRSHMTVHNFHVHSGSFQIIAWDGSRDVPEQWRGWKDTVYLPPGTDARILMRFDNEGLFPYHCHILEHEDAGMMGQFRVIDKPKKSRDKKR